MNKQRLIQDKNVSAILLKLLDPASATHQKTAFPSQAKMFSAPTPPPTGGVSVSVSEWPPEIGI